MCTLQRLSFFGVLIAATSLSAQEKLTVHEWGTFTVLQNERGIALPGVNINEEALPKFVHRLARDVAPDSHELAPILQIGTHERFSSKGIPRSCPAARMRMETPILYFYPPEGAPLPFVVDVRVDFYRGWISEWYPNAKVEAPGFSNRKRPRAIPVDGSGSIRWNGLRVGSKKAPPKTKSKVWLAPRVRKAATVETPKGQADRYLFYRGIADLTAPLRVQRERDTLHIRANPDAPGERSFRVPALWLVDVRSDGKVAFRELPALTVDKGKITQPTRVMAGFANATYKDAGQSMLRASMRRAIQRAGLFPPEAKAMLKTWEVSYFHSPGLRLFFVLPRKWIDTILPLSLSKPANVERVMIGRIEIVTLEQRKIARELGALAKVTSSRWFDAAIRKLPPKQRATAWQDLATGRQTLRTLGITVPADYALYLKLGRFRDAIVLEESRRRPTEALTSFVKNYNLEYFHQSEAAPQKPRRSARPRRSAGDDDR